MKLKETYSTTIYPKAPYHFKYSTRNPSHFPAPTGDEEEDKIWFTMRWEENSLGIKLVNKRTVSKPSVKVYIYSKKKIDYKKIIDELAYRLEWYKDLTELYQLLNKKYPKIVKKFKGMRMFCIDDLYEYLMIAILLQNTHVKRTVKMTQVMLEKYGDLLEFDNREFYCFWPPKRILKIKEEELRSLKVGYRAKSFLRASQDYLKLNEFEMRKVDDNKLKKNLLSIYGVGPASLDYIMFGVFHHKDALNTIPPWEAKIYSKLLKVNTTDPKELLSIIKKQFGRWKGYAMYYLCMDLTWKHKEKPIEWFGKIMPY